jgi:hypothetical protein
MTDTGSEAHDGFRPACRWRKGAAQLKVGRASRMPREYVRRVPEMAWLCRNLERHVYGGTVGGMV